MSKNECYFSTRQRTSGLNRNLSVLYLLNARKSSIFILNYFEKLPKEFYYNMIITFNVISDDSNVSVDVTAQIVIGALYYLLIYFIVRTVAFLS